MNFVDAESYLFSLGNEVAAMKLGLENIRRLLSALGDPHEKYLKVQVAGTNGKGSVCVFLDSICREANVKTGLYTSPHLISITERIRIDGIDISESEFARIATHVRETAEKLLTKGTLEYRPTFFEQMTAIALVAFAEANVELAILETGLGGRLDATTAANAEIAAITRIDLDHQEYLGDTLEQIAGEKAAIIGAHTKSVVIGEQMAEARAVIEERFRHIMGENSNVQERAFSSPSCTFLNSEAHSLRVVSQSLGLKGDHQIENANIAVALAETLRDKFDIADANIRNGLATACHPGRLEYSGKYLFDGAHNVAGARALSAFLEKFESRPITLVFGIMKDKDVDEIADLLFARARTLVFTKPDNPRSMSAAELSALVPLDFDLRDVFRTETVADALNKAIEVTPNDGIILVTGSLYLVGEVKRLIISV